MQPTKALFVLLALAACSQPVPDSGAGVGFGDYSDYVRQREAGGMGPASNPDQTGFSTERVGAALDNAAAGRVAPASTPGASTPGAGVQPQTGPQTGLVIGQPATRPRGNAPAGIQEQQGEILGAVAISDEQDFEAVSARESIESDAERMAQNRAQYEVVSPTALPERAGDSGPNIVKFALSTTHAPGVQMYRRGGLFQRDPLVTCGKYASPDLAQEQFLARGGPERDREGLDPDGDGFACGWDPRPFRKALQ
jgi:hypothetical protein